MITAAGRSARRMAYKLWLKNAKDAAAKALLPGAGGAVAVWVPSEHVVGSLAAGAGLWALVALLLARKSKEARRWLQGGMAELRTAVKLVRFRATGWWFAHDRKAGPKSKANLDHIGIHPSGRAAAYLDTKAWHAKNAVVRVDRGRLMYGPWNQTDRVDTVKWEASKLAEGLPGVPVVPIIVCDRTKVQGGLLEFNGVLVVEAARVGQALARVSNANRSRVRSMRARHAVRSKFPAAK